MFPRTGTYTGTASGFSFNVDSSFNNFLHQKLKPKLKLKISVNWMAEWCEISSKKKPDFVWNVCVSAVSTFITWTRTRVRGVGAGLFLSNCSCSKAALKSGLIETRPPPGPAAADAWGLAWGRWRLAGTPAPAPPWGFFRRTTWTLLRSL